MKIPGIGLASMIVVAGLVYYQYSWMEHSRLLTEEIFNQKVVMALCSAVEDCSSAAGCSSTCQQLSTLQDSAGLEQVSTRLIDDGKFNLALQKSLAFYQLPDDYLIHEGDAEEFNKLNPPSCAVNLLNDEGKSQGMLALEFPQKEEFIAAHLGWMPWVTILILLFTVSVLLSANWLLLRQKRLLSTNLDFFNNIAHEFNTPLTNIGLATNMLRKKYHQLQHDPLVDIVRKESLGLLDQTSHILDLARVENEGFSIEKIPLNFKLLLEKALDEMAIQAVQNEAVISVENIPEHLEILADPHHLKNVLKNLIDNALKYGGENPKVTIRAEVDHEGILISVEDNGIGFSDREGKRIFERFHRINSHPGQQKKGFGLGLSYVKKIMDLHHGSVRAISEPEKGSTFFLFLPKGV